MYPQSRHSRKEFTYTSLLQEHTPPPAKRTKTTNITGCDVEEEIDDPGCIFILNSDVEVHQVLGLPAVANLSPSL